MTRASINADLVTSNRVRSLDGLRGLAVIAVIGYHFGVPGSLGGYLGVDVFFVLSGFVVMRSLVRTMSRPGWQRQFFVRRLARLIPAVIPLLIFWTVWTSWQTPGFSRSEIVALIGAAIMTYNIALLFERADEGLVHLWSLAVEWHFYLFAPVLIRLFGTRRRSAATLFCAAGLAVFVRSLLVATRSVEPMTAYLATWFRLDGLVVGSALALVSQSTLQRVRPWVSSIALATLGLLTVIGPVWYSKPLISLLVTMPSATIATAIVVAALASGTAPSGIDRVLSSRALVWFGERSYSLYLWHYVVGVMVIGRGSEEFQGITTLALQLLLALVAGWISYGLIEEPARVLLTEKLRPRVKVHAVPTTPAIGRVTTATMWTSRGRPGFTPLIPSTAPTAALAWSERHLRRPR